MKKLLFILSIILLTSCSPQLYFTGVGMRKFNTSQNKYTNRHPYVSKPERVRYYSSWWRIWFIKK